MTATIQRFLKQRAVNVAVQGSYTLHHWYNAQGTLRVFTCRTTRISPFRLIAEVPVTGRAGDRLTAYFREFGELEASVTDTMPGYFLLKLEMDRKRRAWMARKLAWLEKKQGDPTIQDAREDARFVPKISSTTLTFADGSVHPCSIIDVSSGGVAIITEHEPPLGTAVAIGACVGRVIRLFSNGFAVKFAEKYNADEVVRLVVRQDMTNSISDSKLD